MKLSDFRYPLPRNLIAKFPAHPRDSSRLLVMHRDTETFEDLKFSEITRFFKKRNNFV